MNGLHELLKDDKRGQAADPAAVEREQAELLIRHGWRATAANLRPWGQCATLVVGLNG